LVLDELPPVSGGSRVARVSDAAERIDIVLADDHALIRGGLRRVLELETDLHVVGEAADVQGALALTRQHQPRVVVLDLKMPGAPTLPAIPRFLEAAPGTAVVVLTMEAEPGFARSALTAGARGYVLKEAAEADLVEAVRSVLAGRTYLDPRLGAMLAQLTPEAAGRHPGLSHGEPNLAVGTDFAGHQIDAFLGQGGMGLVFRATDRTLDRTVALKLVAPAVAGTPELRADEHLTRTGVTLGSVDYIAPEQAHGANVDAGADIYSLGCVLFHMLTGRVVFDRDNDLEKLWAHVHDAPDRLQAANPDLPAGLQDVLDRALAKDPRDRHQSAARLARDAAEALAY
jgi:DNA-binding NarL/FixJ family response regulator